MTRIFAFLALLLLALPAQGQQLSGGVPSQLGNKPTILAANGMACNGSIDDTAALQAAVTAAQGLGGTGGILLLPPGICKISGTINVTGPVVIEGAGYLNQLGNSGTIVRGTACSSDLFSVATQETVVFRDFKVDSPACAGARTAGAAIALTGTAGDTANNLNRMSFITHVRIDGFYDGVRLDEAMGTRFIDNRIEGVHDGVLQIDSANPDEGGGEVYIGNVFWDASTVTGAEASNPFTTASGSATVTIHHPSHGLVAGQVAVWNGAATFNNVTMNGPFVVQSVIDADDFTVTAATTANAGGAGGGASVNYSYGPDAALSVRGGGSQNFVGNSTQGWAYGYRLNATYGPTGGARIAGNSFEDWHVAAVSLTQAVAGVEYANYSITGNEFSTIPANAGAQPAYGDFYVGEGTPNTSPKWIRNLAYTGNHSNDYDSLATGVVTILDGDGIAIADNVINDNSTAGSTTAISIAGNATHAVEWGNEAANFPSGKYGTMLAGSLDTLSSQNKVNLQYGGAASHSEAAIELDNNQGSLWSAIAIDNADAGGNGGEISFRQNNSAPIGVIKSHYSTHWLLDLLGGSSSGLEIVDNAHLVSLGGSAPAASSCGTTPSVSGNDVRGTVTIGSGTVTACTLTFHVAYGAAPVVMLTGIGTGSTVVSLSGAPSATAFTIAASASIGGQAVGYWVMQ
jgi:hypothetical protein